MVANICRLCLYKGSSEQILSVWDSQVEDLPNKIWTCVSIKITKDDDLPTTACLACIHQVTQWVIFKETCEKSNSILLNNFIQTKVIESKTGSGQVFQHLQENSIPEHENINFETSKYDKTEEIKAEGKDLIDTDDSDFDEDFYDLDNQLNICNSNYVCEICKSEFDNCNDYLDHQREHNGKPVFKCDKCPQIFDSREKIVEHDRNHKKSCPHCGKIILRTSMKSHLIKHTNRHVCTHCSNRFNCKAALSQHIITVHTNIKNHVCDTCGKRFSSKTAMRVHMKCHSDERQYNCKLCSYAGRTSSALYIHMATHSTDVCVCEICSKMFKSNRNLNDHLRRVHSNVKRHECNYCNKKFVDRYMLSMHIRYHTGARPYKCTICSKTFVRTDGLKEHLLVHTKKAAFRCQNCSKTFKSKKGLTRHNCKVDI